MIKSFPKTLDYLSRYKDELKKRSIKPFLSLRDKIKKAKSKNDRERAEEELDKNFYILDNIGTYTFAPYKVVWSEMAGTISGKALSFACAVVEPINGKPVVHDHSVRLIPVEKPDEAYYIAGILNSIIARSIIAAYTYEIRQETNIVDFIKVPKFDPNNNLHKKIADLSKRAHELAKCIYSNNKPDNCKNIDAKKELKKVEDEIDLAVAELYGITKEELEGFKELMDILSGK